jgi:hypothetical protein
MTHFALNRRFALAPMLVISLALALVGNPRLARAADPWDQETVAALAGSFFEAVKEIRLIVRRAPVNVRRQQRLQAEALENFRKMESSARQLKTDLEKGKGRDDTFLQLKRLDMLRNDTVILVRRAAIGADTMAKLAGAGALLKELEYYYYATDDGMDDEKDEAAAE